MKSNNIAQNTVNYLIEQKILVGLSLVFLGLLIIPFWRSNALEIYDSPGHVGLVWFIKEFSWPQFSGWNPFSLSGWPQGIFYPSFFHWLAAGLSFIVSIESAIKILISISILSLPFAVFYTIKNTISKEKYWYSTTFLILIFLIILPNFLGVGFRGLFQIGLIPNFVSTPVFLIFIGLLHSQFKKGKFLWTSLIFAVLIMTHLVAAMMAGAYLLIYSIILWQSGKSQLKSFILVIIISALLTSFFWLPFLLNFSFTSLSVHVSSYRLINLILVVAAAIFAFLSVKSKQTETLALSIIAFFVLSIALVDNFLISNAIDLSQKTLYPFHVYRFQPYAYLVLILASVSLLGNLSWLKVVRGIDFRIISLFLLAILLGYLFIRNPIVTGSDFKIINDPRLDGRFIESFRRTESAPFLYSAQTDLVLDYPTENKWAYGLFTDSTPNGPYLGSLVRSLRPEAYPEGEGVFIETKIIDEKNIQKALDLYGINFVLNLDEVGKGTDIGRWTFGNLQKNYSVEKVSETTLVEVPSLQLERIESNFEEKVLAWWDSEEEWDTLPFLSKSNVDLPTIDKETKVEIVEHNKDWTEMKISIGSEAPQPVLIKFSYFPWWKATANGENVPIYRVAPNQMLIFANGEVELEYKEPIWLNFLYLTSVVTFLVTIRYLLLKR